MKSACWGWRRFALLLLMSLASAGSARAHVGSKDVFETVQAGPYRLFVTVRMPNVIPGVATIEVRSSGASVSGIEITPVPITGEASKNPPTPDAMTRSETDPAFYTGSLWIMASGSWEVKFAISGRAGLETAAVPVPAVPLAILKMQRGMGWTLAGLGLLLIVGMAGIVAAAVRESRLAPGIAPTAERTRRAMLVTAASVVVMGLMVWGGAKWWNVEAAGFADGVYRPLTMTPTLVGNELGLAIEAYTPENTRRVRSNQDFLPDHGHLMHLYAIRQPEMDAVFHLHPEMTGAGEFKMALPAMPAGTYKLYGDVVHASGFPETLLAELNVPATMPGGALAAEDARGMAQPLSKGELPTSFKLPDSYMMVWERPEAITAGTAYAFRFKLLNATGKDATDVQPYLGMAGHAAFVKTDGTVFAHTHPEGSAAMQAVELANGKSGGGMVSMLGMDMAGMNMNHTMSSVVEFPYGFPTAGGYRVFVQMKHGGVVETGVFDAFVR